MPRESRILMKSGETLLDICINTHMALLGSADPLTLIELQRNTEILQKAVDHWQPGRTSSKRFDDAVLELCRATLEELANERHRIAKEWINE